MKKIIVSLISIVLIFSGCNIKKEVGIEFVKENETPIKIVEEYNRAVFTKDWDKAKSFLGGYAAKAFEINVGKYKNSSILIGQSNYIETSCETLSIIESKVDLDIIKENNQRMLSRKWIRYYLSKSDNWKIIKAEDSQEKYPKDINITKNDDENKLITDIVRKFITYSVEGNINEASKYLSENLLNNAEKYKIDQMPKLKLGEVKVNIIGRSDEDCFADAKYFVDNKEINGVFHLIKIKGTWLINNQIS